MNVLALRGVAALCLSVLAGAGCHGANLVARVDTLAATALTCPAEQVVIRERPEIRTYQATGCRQIAVYKCRKDGRCENLTAAARSRFELETRCAQRVEVSEISPLVFLAEGCANQRTYVCSFEDAQVQCLLEPGSAGTGP